MFAQTFKTGVMDTETVAASNTGPAVDSSLNDDQKTIFYPTIQKQYLVQTPDPSDFAFAFESDSQQTVSAAPLHSRLGCPLPGSKTGFTYGPIEREVMKSPWDRVGWGSDEIKEEKTSDPVTWKYTKADELELVECWSLDGIKHTIPKALLVQRSDYFARMEQDHPQLFSQIRQSDAGLTLFMVGDVCRCFVDVLLYGFLIKLHSHATFEEKAEYMQLISSLAHYRVKYLLINGSASVFSGGCATSMEYTK